MALFLPSKRDVKVVQFTRLWTVVRNLFAPRPNRSKRPSANYYIETLETRVVPAKGGIRGVVFEDDGGDGVRQTADAGIPGRTVELRNALGSVVQQVTTDSVGKYLFGNLDDGIYTVRQVLPAGWAQTGGSSTYTVTILAGSIVQNMNFGDFELGTFSGTVGMDGAGSTGGLANWTVQLLNSSGSVIGESRTNSVGNYTFAGLRAGTYGVREVVLPGWIQSSGPVSYSYQVVSGTDRDGVNFGNSGSAAISGKVFEDIDADGVRDVADLGMTGITVQLLTESGTVVRQTTTGSSGAFSFMGVGPGKYRVKEILPSDYARSTATATYSLTVIAGADIKNINFGNYKAGRVTGKVFQDSNQDGALSFNEQLLQGWTVQLVDSSDQVVKQVVTGSSGSYSFSGLLSGNYQLRQIPPAGSTDHPGPVARISVTSSSALSVNLPINPVTSVIDITDDWLQSQGPGPYLLSTPNATYVLQTDVTVDGTAFVVGAPNVTLDLNGHTVTYGNSAPVDVTNGGFETGTDSNIPGWDLSGASGAVLLPARLGMWGNSMLEIPNFTTKQTILSDPITIPSALREYVATITPKGTAGTIVTLTVIDAVTGEVLGSGDSNAVEHGFSATAAFTSANPVRLKVELTPPAGVSATVDLDYATVLASEDFGIMASPSTWYFPTQLSDPSITAVAKKASEFTVQNGSIIQGQAHSYGSSAVNAISLIGFTMTDVNTYLNGMDGMNVDATYATNVTIKDSTFAADIDNVSNRKQVFAAINLSKNKGDVLVDGNTIINAPQVGIAANDNTGGTLRITNNSISQRAVVANAYGIMLSGVSNFVIGDNDIITTAGRGISLDSWDSAISDTGDIYGNYVDVQVGPDLEYGESFMVAAALRIRNYNGAQRNVHIHDNTFIASTGLGLGQTAVGLRIQQKNALGQMDDANNVIENNIFKAVVTTTNSSYHAWAVAISGVDAGTGLIFRNNDFQSNEVSLQLGDDANYKSNNNDILFVGNQFTKLNEGAARTYFAVQVGDSNNSVSSMRLIDNKLNSGSALNFNFLGTGIKDVGTGWLLNINATTTTGTAASAATVKIYDANNKLVFSGITDGNGQLADIPIVTSLMKQTTTNLKSLLTLNNNSFDIAITRAGKTVRKTVSITGNSSVDIQV